MLLFSLNPTQEETACVKGALFKMQNKAEIVDSRSTPLLQVYCRIISVYFMICAMFCVWFGTQLFHIYMLFVHVASREGEDTVTLIVKSVQLHLLGMRSIIYSFTFNPTCKIQTSTSYQLPEPKLACIKVQSKESIPSHSSLTLSLSLSLSMPKEATCERDHIRPLPPKPQ